MIKGKVNKGNLVNYIMKYESGDFEGEDFFELFRDQDSMVLKVLPSKKRGGIKINFKNYFLYQDLNVKIESVVKFLSGAQTMAIGIKDSPIRNERIIGDRWQTLGLDSVNIAKDVPNSKFLIELSSPTSMPFLVKQITVKSLKDETLLLKASFQDLFFPEELYNLAIDPTERNNLLFEQGTVSNILEAELHKLIDSNSEMSMNFDKNEEVDLRQSIQKRLKALGYMD